MLAARDEPREELERAEIRQREAEDQYQASLQICASVQIVIEDLNRQILNAYREEACS